MGKKKFTYDYPHPAVATDCVVYGFDGHELKILLIERGIEPYKGMWALPGGFLRMDETAEQCAVRELQEETGLSLTYLKQFKTFSDVNRDPRERVISIAFYALAQKSDVQGGDDAAQARWFALNEVPRLAFDHDYILRKAMEKLREDIHFEPIGFGLLDQEFTMSELQRLYEAILGVQFDRRNFHKKMLQTGIIEEAAEDDGATFFGKNREMRSMSIDVLFGDSAAEKPASCSSPRPTSSNENDCNHTVSGDSGVDLYANCILGLTPEPLDIEVLLHPFEEQFNLPSAFV